MLARPGTYGSSGQHTYRRQYREIKVVDAAISAIKHRHGFERLLLVGQSGGGLLVGAMLSRRQDIACAVISSGLVAVKRRNQDLRQDDPTGLPDVYDPADHVTEISRTTGLHVIVLTDPTDRNVTASSQADYVARLKAHGVSVQHIAVPGRGPNNHNLDEEGIAAGADWLNGMTGDSLTRKYGTTF